MLVSTLNTTGNHYPVLISTSQKKGGRDETGV